MAAAYQSATMMATTVTTGRTRSAKSPGVEEAASCKTAVSVVIAMPRAQGLAHSVGDSEERRRLSHVEAATGGKVAVHNFKDAPGTRTHHHDPAGQEHRLGDGVRDEHDR